MHPIERQRANEREQRRRTGNQGVAPFGTPPSTNPALRASPAPHTTHRPVTPPWQDWRHDREAGLTLPRSHRAPHADGEAWSADSGRTHAKWGSSKSE